MPIIQGKILESSIINTDGWKAYNGLILNGLNDKKFILHLKESEFRFNNRKQNLYKILLKMIRENPL
jgi:transposase-like protein